MLESELESKVVAWVESQGGLALKLRNFVRGWPDRTILLPGGRIYFVELKRPGRSKTYRQQTHWKDLLTRLGFPVGIFDNLEDVKEFCR